MSRSDPRPPKTYQAGPVAVMCLSCGQGTENHPDGRPRHYCSDRCRVAAFRARSKGKSAGDEGEGTRARSQGPTPRNG